MTKRITVLLIVSALVVVAGPIGASNEFVDFEVPDDYVGPAIDWVESKEVRPGHVDLDWYDPKGQPVVQYAAQFGVDAETAVALLRWQRDLNGRNGDFQALASYGLARIVGPSPTNGGGGLEVFLKNPTQEDLAVVESLPKPPLGEVVVRKAFFTAAEALELVDREQARFRNQVGDDAFFVVTTDWETGVIAGEVRERPPTTEGHGCPLSTQTGGIANGGRSMTVAYLADCEVPAGSCTAAFAVYFNGKQGVLTAGHCATDAWGEAQGQHFVTDTIEGIDLRCVSVCSTASKGYFPNYTSAEFSATRSYAALRPYYNDKTIGWDDYAMWRERYASTQPSGELYIVPGGTAGLNGFFGGFFHITSYAKDSQFPKVGTWVCQGAGNLALRGGLHCGFIENNPGITFTTTTHRSVDVEWGVLSKPGGGVGSSGGPWFYDNIGLGIHTGVSAGPNFWGSFERIEPVFIQLQQVSSTTKLYCMSSATGGSTVTCVP